MAEELISSYIDQAAIKSQTDFLVQQLERAKTQYKSLSDAIKNIQKSSSFTDTAKITAQAEKEQQALLKTQQQIIKAKQEQVKLENQLLQQQILQEKQAQANLRTTQQQSKVKTSIVTESITKPGFSDDVTKSGTAISEFDKAQAEAAISATEFGNSLNKQAKVIKDEVTPAVKATTLTAKQLALAKAEGAILAAKETAALKNQVREELAVKGSLEQRRAALIRLNAVYDAQGPTERASAAGQRLQKILAGLDTQVKTLESTTGRSQRNVGNYSSALGAVGEGAKKAFSGIRQVANIIPGLGISGIFLAGFEAIKYFVDGVGKAGSALFTFSKLRDEAAKSGAADLANITALKVKITDLSLSESERIKYAKEYNKVADEGNKIDLTQINNLDLINTKIEKQIGLIKARALSKAAENALTEQAEKVISAQIEVDRFKEYEDGKKLQALLKENAKSEAETNKYNQKNNSDNLSNKNNLLKSTALLNGDIIGGQKKYISAKKKLDEEQRKLDKLADRLSPFFTPDKGGADKLSGATKAQQKLSDLLDESFERYKLRQQRLLDTLNEGANDESAVYETRLKFLEDFNKEQKNLIDNQEVFELQKNENKKIAAIKAAKGNAAEIAIVTANAEEAAKTITLMAQLGILKADEDYYKRKLKLREDYNKMQQEFADQEYEYERLLNEKLEKLRQDRLKGMKDFEAKDKKDLEDKKNRILSYLETIQVYFTQVSGLISGALNIGFTKRKNESEEAIEQIEKQRDAELKANEARVASEQDKAAAVALINARAESQKRQQEQRQKQIDREKAVADKALSIFQIILATAVAVAKALTPFGKAFAAISGAAQIAIALATPIPRFKHGKRKGQAYEGPGIVNDGPNMEVIERSDGSIEMPSGRNVLTHVGKDDEIHPDRGAWANAVLGAALRDSRIGSIPSIKQDDKVYNTLVSQTKLLKQIAGKKEFQLNATDRGMVALHKWGASQVNYVNENTNW